MEAPKQFEQLAATFFYSVMGGVANWLAVADNLAALEGRSAQDINAALIQIAGLPQVAPVAQRPMVPTPPALAGAGMPVGGGFNPMQGFQPGVPLAKAKAKKPTASLWLPLATYQQAISEGHKICAYMTKNKPGETSAPVCCAPACNPHIETNSSENSPSPSSNCS